MNFLRKTLNWEGFGDERGRVRRVPLSWSVAFRPHREGLENADIFERNMGATDAISPVLQGVLPAMQEIRAFPTQRATLIGAPPAEQDNLMRVKAWSR